MGQRPKGTSIERIDNDKGYSPRNCRWATPAEQMRNTRANRMVKFRGKTQCVVSWAKELKIPAPTLFGRLRKGMTAEEAFCTPRKKVRLVIAHKGKSMTLDEWAEHLGINRCSLATRWYKGYRGKKLFEFFSRTEKPYYPPRNRRPPLKPRVGPDQG